MSIEYDMSKFPRSRGAQCGVLLDRHLFAQKVSFMERGGLGNMVIEN